MLVPFRGDGAQRDKLWDYCRPLFESLPVELVIGEDPGNGPFNISRAFNAAAREATGDIFVLYGADQIPDWDRIQWAANKLTNHAWCQMYASRQGFTEEATAAILTGAPLDGQPTEALVGRCPGIMAVRADKWFPMDEHFQGWGYEDEAFRVALTAMYGRTPPPTGTLRFLYHPPASRDFKNTNRGMYAEYKAAAAAGTMREFLNARRQLQP